MQAMQQGIRRSAWVVLGTALACGPAIAQDVAGGARPGSGLGLNTARLSMPIGCGASLLPCGTEQASLAALREPRSLRWSVELAPVNVPAVPRSGWTAGRQGLSLSVVGRQPLFGSSFSLYGRLGTASTSLLAEPAMGPGAFGEPSYGVAFGAGVSMDFTQRLSASFGIDSYELRAGGNGPVRSTNLGLQYRY